MDQLLDFTGKVILITGAASGFGKQLALDFSSRGAKLVLGDINIEGVQAVADTLDTPCFAMKCDVSKESECEAMVSTAIKEFGRLDIAINNAGISHTISPLHTLSDDIIDAQFSINVKGVMYGIKHQVKAMIPQGEGVILNVSSMAGLGGAPMLGAYSAAKHAVIGLTKTASVEYAKLGIRTNAICPFFALTPMVTDSDLMTADQVASTEMLAKNCPMKRLGETREITDFMLMMCSPANSYMNGQCIAVDGGVSAI